MLYVTVSSLDVASTNLDKSNEPKITQIRQLEAVIFAISIFESKSIDLYRKCFPCSSDVGTGSLTYVKLINLG